MNNCDKTVWDVLDKCDDKVNMKPQVVSSYMHITCFFSSFQVENRYSAHTRPNTQFAFVHAVCLCLCALDSMPLLPCVRHCSTTVLINNVKLKKKEKLKQMQNYSLLCTYMRSSKTVRIHRWHQIDIGGVQQLCNLRHTIIIGQQVFG